jgi:hypothetical protein
MIQGAINKKIFFSLAVFVFLFSFFCTNKALAADVSLYFSPSANTQSVGSRFVVTVKINTNGQPVNATQGVISFSNESLKVVGVSGNNSAFAFWTKEPSFSNQNGTIEFGGGVPSPGYNGNGGQVFSITFQALEAGSAEVTFVSGSVLANDGKGTNILTGMGGANFSIVPASDPGVGLKNSEKTGDVSVAPEIFSDTDPDQDRWYRNRQIKFYWKMPAEADGVSVAFDKNANTDPGENSIGIVDNKEFIAESDGVWYLHLRIKDKKGWSGATHRPVRIDTTPPEDFEVWTKQEDPNDWPTVFFKTVDKMSGVVKYALVVNSLKSEPYIVSSDKDSLKITNLEVGNHTVMVRAIDEAGNESFSTIEFEIKPILEPKIDDFSREFSPDDHFFVSGTSIPDAAIKLFVKDSQSDNVLTYSLVADKSGRWSFVMPNGLKDGRYVFWAEATNSNGLTSRSSSVFSFLVTPPVFVRFGSVVVDYFTVFASLLFVLAVVIFLFVSIARMLRRKLRKETIEIEQVLDKNLEVLRTALAEESLALIRIAKDKSKSGARSDIVKEVAGLKQRLDERIDNTGRRIMKEVRDVEKILK